MRTVTFSGCFGWLHPGTARTGVVLCAPHGQEGVVTYRGLRVLAERLSARGLSVLRFDYPGVGDSSGEEADPDRLLRWRQSIVDASALLRRSTSVERVILVGFRLGASLAWEASENDPSVVALAGLAPVISGRRYVRELRMLANGWREANLLAPSPPSDGFVEFIGDRLADATLADLSKIDLRARPVHVSDMLLMDNDFGALVGELTDCLRQKGVRVTQAPFPQGSEFLQEAFSTDLPESAFHTLVEWCVERAGDASVAGEASSASLHREPRLDLPEAVERPIMFGTHKQLFGIVCEPHCPRPATSPAVLMINTGFGRRTGDGRVYVTLARRLAKLGVPSMRIDVAGFGDSAARDHRPADPYAFEAAQDVVAAADALTERGYGPLIVVGICSGAHTAFHAALRDARIRRVVLGNLQKLVWKSGASLKVENRRQRRPAMFYVKAAIRQEAWRRILRREVAVDTIALALLRRPFVGLHHRLSLTVEGVTGLKTESGQPKRWVDGLAARGTTIDFLYTEGDPGLAELATFFGSGRRRARSLRSSRVTTIPQADHALLDHRSREIFVETVCNIARDAGAASSDLPQARSGPSSAAMSLVTSRA